MSEVIEHMEVDFIFSRLHSKYNLRIMDIGSDLVNKGRFNTGNVVVF